MKRYTYINDNNNICAVDNVSGEILETIQVTVPIGTKMRTPAQQEAQKHFQEKEYTKHLYRSKKTFYFLSRDFTAKQITPESIGRLVYLYTFLSYDNTFQKTERENMKKSDLQDILGVSRATMFRFWNEISPEYIIENENGDLQSMNPDFIKGCLKKNHESYQKLFVKPVQTLYESLNPSKHRYLGYIYQILPFINIEYNILCHNPLEKNLYDIEPMTAQELCENIGYDANNFSKLMKIYQNITFTINNHEEYFVMIIPMR